MSSTYRASYDLTRSASTHLFTGVRERGILRSPDAGSCITPPLRGRNRSMAPPWSRSLSLRLVAPHKDALGCLGKHRPRRRWAISINGQRFRSGRRLGGGGHLYATGVRVVATLAAKILGSGNLVGPYPGLCITIHRGHMLCPADRGHRRLSAPSGSLGRTLFEILYMDFVEFPFPGVG